MEKYIMIKTMTKNNFELDLSYFQIITNSERGDCGLQLTTEDKDFLAYWTADDFAECSEIEFEDTILNILKDIINIAKEKSKILGLGEVSWERKLNTIGKKILTTKSPVGRIIIEYFPQVPTYILRNNLEIKECGILMVRSILNKAGISNPTDEDFNWLKNGTINEYNNFRNILNPSNTLEK